MSTNDANAASLLPQESTNNEEEETHDEIVYIAIHQSRTKTSSTTTAPPLSLPFFHSRHVKYIHQLVKTLDQPTSYEGAVTEHLRMSGIYWSWMALSLLTPVTLELPEWPVPNVVDWVMACYDPSSGGFGGNIGQDAHILYTLSAVQILALANRLDDPRLNVPAITNFCVSLQQGDGSFCGDHVDTVSVDTDDNDDDDQENHSHYNRRHIGGEIDTRFTYCALATLAILHHSSQQQSQEKESKSLSELVQLRKAAEYIMQCQNSDGGFGCVVGAESHAGQVFCCIGALAIAQSLDLLLPNHHNNNNNTGSKLLSPLERLAWWLSERQVDSGGLNGRSEKQADVCYSWWILSALSILGRTSWINGDRLGQFILQCQDDQDGGIADRPEDMPDVFHTFFGIAGLSLLGHLHLPQQQHPQQQTALNSDQNSDNISDGNRTTTATPRTYRKVDPVYALPTDVVDQLGLSAQVVAPLDGNVDDRLQQYQVIQPRR